MNITEAIDTRFSCRAFADKPVEREKFDQLQECIDAINVEAGLNFQLYGPREGGAAAIDMSEGMFAGTVPCYAALVAPDDVVMGEKVGYYGEKLVLFATQLGLNTCWVASTYDRHTTRAKLQPGDLLWDVVPIGYAMDPIPDQQQSIRKSMRRRDKPLLRMTTADVPLDDLPVWYASALESVYKGPSAANGQPVTFDYRDDRVTADFERFSRKIELNDLGIAKLHFELGARAAGVEGAWDWGLGAEFKHEHMVGGVTVS